MATLSHVSGERFTIEVEPEVRRWLEKLPAHLYLRVEARVDLLAEERCDEPLSVEDRADSCAAR